MAVNSASRALTAGLIALMVWLPASLAWASCCAVSMSDAAGAQPTKVDAHVSPAAPCHGRADLQAQDVHQAEHRDADTLPITMQPGMQHADGSACAHGAGCTLAASASPFESSPIALDIPAIVQARTLEVAVPDAPMFRIDHPPSLT